MDDDKKDKVVSLKDYKREKQVDEAINSGVQKLVDKWIGKYGANLPLILSNIQEIIYNEDTERIEFELKTGERLTEDDAEAKIRERRRVQNKEKENNLEDDDDNKDKE